MNFKYPVIEKEYLNAPQPLKALICDISRFSEETFGITITITRILGKIKGDSGVHAQYRAVDIRDEHQGVFTYTKKQSKLMADWINEKYKRLDGYPTCYHHSFKGAPAHYHCQLPKNVFDLRSGSYDS